VSAMWLESRSIGPFTWPSTCSAWQRFSRASLAALWMATLPTPVRQRWLPGYLSPRRRAGRKPREPWPERIGLANISRRQHMYMPPNSRLRLDPKDEYTHEPEPVSNYNESMYFNAFDTASGVGAWMRIGNRPNEGHAEMSCCVYLPDGRVGFMFERPAISGN